MGFCWFAGDVIRGVRIVRDGRRGECVGDEGGGGRGRDVEDSVGGVLIGRRREVEVEDAADRERSGATVSDGKSTGGSTRKVETGRTRAENQGVEGRGPTEVIAGV